MDCRKTHQQSKSELTKPDNLKEMAAWLDDEEA
jgi:hypothetical protein